jgi:hypothetical protein
VPICASSGARTVLWVEAGLSLPFAGTALLTVVWRDWIEGIFGVDPDQHSGSLE